MGYVHDVLLLKPAGVQLRTELLEILEKFNIKVVGELRFVWSEEIAKRVYSEHRYKPWFKSFIEYLSDRPGALIFIKRPAVSPEIFKREVVGPTRPWTCKCLSNGSPAHVRCILYRTAPKELKKIMVKNVDNAVHYDEKLRWILPRIFGLDYP